jgi:leader peptidase (prepilin peptidase) / N-methyltransferase
VTDRAWVETTERQGRPAEVPARRPDRVVPVVVAVVTLVVVGVGWSAPGPGPLLLVGAAGVIGALVVGPFLAYEVQRWIGWRVVVPLLVGYVAPPRAVRRAPSCCGTCGSTDGPLAHRARSWLARAGRCRSCGVPVPGWVAAVELATGVGFALAAWRLGWTWRLAPALPFVAGLVAVTAVDVVHQRIPTRFVVAAGTACAAAGIPAALLAGAGGVPATAVLGAVAYGGFLTFLYLASPRGLGGGDVRLAWLAGGVVGGLTWTADAGTAAAIPHVLTTAVLAAVIGLVTHLAVALAGHRSRTLPFAPAMTAAALLVALLAQPA